jgi:predicted RNA-binding protein with PUA-like domain
MNYWLVKQEPEAYSWSTFVKDGHAAWTGVRNFQARNNLRAMKKGDLVCYYHSVSEKQVVGIARVVREAYPDATAEEGDWSCVDLAPVQPLKQPVTLEQIKADKLLKSIPLVKQSRLSVTPLASAEFTQLLKLGATKVK